MSTTNFNQPNTPAPYSTGNNNQDGQKRLLTIAGIAIALLLGITLFFAIGNYRKGQEVQSLNMNLEQQTAALNEVNEKYNETVAALEQQKGVNAELDAKINEQLSQLAAQKTQVDQLIRDKKDYRNQLSRLQEQSKQYLAEIEQLKQQVGVLTTENGQLKTDNQTLTTNLNDTKSQLDQTTQAKAALISEKTQLESTNAVLSKKADRGSAIDVKNFEIKSLAVSSSGKEKTKSRAKKVDKISICFTTEANEVVDAGEETFNLIVIDPLGKTLQNEALGSGVTRDKKADSEFRYTTTTTVSYNNQETKVCGAWQPGENFPKGTYTVEVYNKGYKVGSSTFKLK